MYKIQTLNNISVKGLRRLPRETYEVASEIGHPDAILVRSANMHEMSIPETVRAIGRAGAGTNNIPITTMSERGVPVFNAPGANANAVKELVLASLFVAARNIKGALAYVDALEGSDAEISKAVEAGKKRFAGHELPGRRLGVIGLGAIGVEVCNAALALGMEVVGYDPHMTVRRAWQLSAGVKQADTLDQLFQHADAITVHVPLMDATANLVNKDRLALMNDNAMLVNFARGGVVDDAAAIAALDSGKLHSYVTDFPTPELIVAENVKDYLENGNIRYSVNFPEARMPRMDAYRITIANANVPNMVGQISTCLADASLNIEDLLNKSSGDIAYTIVDVNGPVTKEIEDTLRGIDGVLTLRNLGKPVT